MLTLGQRTPLVRGSRPPSYFNLIPWIHTEFTDIDYYLVRCLSLYVTTSVTQSRDKAWQMTMDGWTDRLMRWRHRACRRRRWPPLIPITCAPPIVSSGAYDWLAVGWLTSSGGRRSTVASVNEQLAAQSSNDASHTSEVTSPRCHDVINKCSLVVAVGRSRSGATVSRQWADERWCSFD